MDAITSRDFDDFFEDLLRSGERYFLLRADQLESVSSAGIGSLVKFARRLAGIGGRAAFVRLSEEVQLLLEFFGLAELLPAYATVDVARAAFEESLAADPGRKFEIERERSYLARTPAQAATRTHSHSKLESYAERPAEAQFPPRRSASAPGPRPACATETQPEVLPDPGPTEAERELMADAGPTEAEREVLADVGPTDAERQALLERDAADNRSTPRRAVAPEVRAEHHFIQESHLDQEPELRLRSEADREGARRFAAGGPADSDPATRELDEADWQELHAQTRTAAPDDAIQRDDLHGTDQPTDGHEFGENAPILGCQQCGVNLRVYRSGLHMCPACGIEFDVRRDGNVSFYEKL